MSITMVGVRSCRVATNFAGRSENVRTFKGTESSDWAEDALACEYVAFFLYKGEDARGWCGSGALGTERRGALVCQAVGHHGSVGPG